MAKILLEVQVDSSGAVSSLRQVEAQIHGVGTANTDAARSVDANERATQRLLNRLEPTRVASERLTRQKELLRNAYESGQISNERYQSALARLESTTGRATTTTQKLFQAAAGYVTFEAVRRSIESAVGAYADAEVAQLRLEAVLRATGYAAGLSADQLSDMATRFQGLTGVSDEVIKSGQAVLLTFKSIRGDAFERTMAAALDLSATFGTDLKSSVMQLGKALEDPERGLTALRRVGVSFEPEQEKLILGFHRSGEAAAAQAEILKVLEGQFHKTAETVAGGLTGSWNKFKHALNDTMEVEGKIIAQTLRFTGALDLLTVATVKARTVKEQNRASADKLFAALSNGTGVVDAFRIALDRSSKAAGGKTIQVLTLAQAVARSTGEQKVSDDVVKAATSSLEKSSTAVRDEAKARTERERAIEAESKALWEQQLEIGSWQAALIDAGYSWEEVGRLGHAALQELARWSEFVTDTTNRMLARLETAPDMSESLAAIRRASEEASGYIDGVWEFPGSPPSKPGWWDSFWKAMGTDVEQALNRGLATGFLDVLHGDSFRRGWETAWEDLARVAAGELSKISMQILFGGGGPLGQGFEGLFGKAGFGDWWEGLGGLQQAAIAGGGLLWGYGARRGNQAVGAAGGALSGAGLGYTLGKAGSLGGPWGAVIGGVLGAVVGWFTSKGQKTPGYSISGSASWPRIAGDGLDDVQRAQLQREAVSTYRGYRTDFRSMLHSLGQTLGDDPAINWALEGKTSDFGTLWQSFLGGHMPRTMFSHYRDQLGTGLGELGVSDDRVQQMFGELTRGDWATGWSQLSEWVSTIMDADTISGLLGQSMDELRDSVTMSSRESWLQDWERSFTRMQDLGEIAGDLFSSEQVSYARQILDIAGEQYDQALAYFGQLQAYTDSLLRGNESLRQTWAEQLAREQGPEALGSYYQQQVQDLMARLSGAGSLEELDLVNQQLRRVLGSAWSLDFGDQDYRLRDWASQWLDQSEQISLDLLGQWQQEAKDRMDLMRDEVDLWAGLLRESVGPLEQFGPGLDDLIDLIDREAEIREQQLGAMAAMTTATTTATSGLQTFADVISQIGGAVVITLELPEGMSAQVAGGVPELVRFIQRGGRL